MPISKWVQLTPGLMERYEPGVFAAQTKDPGRVKVTYGHGEVIGRVTELQERDDGLYFAGTISANADIPEAKRARALLADELLDEVSIGFRSLHKGTDISNRDGMTVWRHKRGQLLEISLVPWGAMGREAVLQRALIVDDFDEHQAERRAALESKRNAEKEWLRGFRARMSA